MNVVLMGAMMAAFAGLVTLFLIPHNEIAGVAALGALGLMILVPAQEIGHFAQLKAVVLAAVTS